MRPCGESASKPKSPFSRTVARRPSGLVLSTRKELCFCSAPVGLKSCERTRTRPSALSPPTPLFSVTRGKPHLPSSETVCEPSPTTVVAPWTFAVYSATPFEAVPSHGPAAEAAGMKTSASRMRNELRILVLHRLALVGSRDLTRQAKRVVPSAVAARQAERARVGRPDEDVAGQARRGVGEEEDDVRRARDPQPLAAGSDFDPLDVRGGEFLQELRCPELGEEHRPAQERRDDAVALVERAVCSRQERTLEHGPRLGVVDGAAEPGGERQFLCRWQRADPLDRDAAQVEE